MNSGDQPQSGRERNRTRTRTAILDAVAQLELFHGGVTDPNVFTYARIAELADVSERTVYRFFPTKADLDHAYVEARPLLAGIDPPDSINGIPDMMRALGRHWSRRFGGRRVRASDDAWEDYQEGLRDRDDRDRRFAGELGEHFDDDIPDRQRVAYTAAVRAPSSVMNMILVAQRWGLTLEEAAEAQAWATETLLAALRTERITPWNLPPEPQPDR